MAALPAALGLASFRVYALTEEKADKQIAPREVRHTHTHTLSNIHFLFRVQLSSYRAGSPYLSYLIVFPQLSIYSAERPALRCVEEEPGQLQTGLGLIRVGLQPYVRAVQVSTEFLKNIYVVTESCREQIWNYIVFSTSIMGWQSRPPVFDECLSAVYL